MYVASANKNYVYIIFHELWCDNVFENKLYDGHQCTGTCLVERRYVLCNTK